MLELAGQRRPAAILKASGFKTAYELFVDIARSKEVVVCGRSSQSSIQCTNTSIYLPQEEILGAWTALKLDAVICPGNALPAFKVNTTYGALKCTFVSYYLIFLRIVCVVLCCVECW